MKKYTLEFVDENTILYRNATISHEYIDEDYKSYIVKQTGIEVPPYLAGTLFEALNQVDQFIDGGHHFKLEYTNFTPSNKYNRKRVIRLDSSEYVGLSIDKVILSDPAADAYFDNIVWYKDTDTFILFSTVTVGKKHSLYEYHQSQANTNKILVIISKKNIIVQAEYCDTIMYALNFSNTYLGVN